MPSEAYTLHLRIPGWAAGAALRINGKPVTDPLVAGSYYAVKRNWKAGDKVELNLPMEVKLMASNPLVEANRGQVAVQRGPIVYCLESKDLPANTAITGVTIAKNSKWTKLQEKIGPQKIMALETTAYLEAGNSAEKKDPLYYPLSAKVSQPVTIRLIPYYSWENRGRADMEVWMPLAPQE